MHRLGEGFASGIIDLGGLEVCQITSFKKIWSTSQDGSDATHVTFFEPSPIPDGFSMLGCWSTNSSCYVWLPTPPEGYRSVGYIVTTSPEKPSFDKIRCVRADLTDELEADALLWSSDDVNVYGLRPKVRGRQAQGVCVGQIDALIKEYSPRFYFHPKETYFVASTQWYFTNGVQLYHAGDESNPIPVESTGSNLPQGGSNDDTYWLDLPVDETEREGQER
ncbi:hypothetical protein L1987_73773 [Smallanthus sonchifolius]|uniref:Uncharacterized protein n=1 Tax=Smallanthus sonchifolius TaxID=185202 RepID=A0ACB9A179_9ASTR|nr:hypothetical protein L1987_73773 [Smallanthus sonchifolius]